MKKKKERKETDPTLALRVGMASHIKPEARDRLSPQPLSLFLFLYLRPCRLLRVRSSTETHPLSTISPKTPELHQQRAAAAVLAFCLRTHQLLLTHVYSQPPGDGHIAFHLHMATVQQLSLKRQSVCSLEWTLF